MQIPALNPLSPTGLASEAEALSPAGTAAAVQTPNVQTSAAQTSVAGSGAAVVSEVSDYRELMDAHTLDPARVAALLADPFGE